MIYRLTSVAIAVLLAGTMLWSQCAACPLMKPAPAPVSNEHDCCPQPAQDDCNASQPAKKCPGQAVAPDSYVKADPVQVAAAAVAPVTVMVAPVPITRPAPAADAAPVVASPPDLYLLNSTLLA